MVKIQGWVHEFVGLFLHRGPLFFNMYQMCTLVEIQGGILIFLHYFCIGGPDVYSFWFSLYFYRQLFKNFH